METLSRASSYHYRVLAGICVLNLEALIHDDDNNVVAGVVKRTSCVVMTGYSHSHYLFTA